MGGTLESGGGGGLFSSVQVFLDVTAGELST